MLQPERIAQTTFYRFLREYQLLAPDGDDHKKRLAFSMKHANQLWQADTMFGPHCDTGLSLGSRKQAKLRYDRQRSDSAVVTVYHKGQRMGAARLLDAVANGLMRRKEQP